MAAEAGIEITFFTASKRDPLMLADAFISMSSLVENDNLEWVADISTMTHEMVLMLVAATDELIYTWQKITFIYNLAEKYSADEKDADKWISRGIQGLRSVVGYSGQWSPGEPAVLIALPGFDLERVSRIIEDIEPEKIMVGAATPSRPEHAWMYTRNKAIAGKLLETRHGSIFDYPALIPTGAIDAILEATSDVSCNVLIAPLNSKISTMAVGVLARLNPAWQVCYAPALIYNLSYSTPSSIFLTCTYSEAYNHAVAAMTIRNGVPSAGSVS
jgi:hypothetical protein